MEEQDCEFDGEVDIMLKLQQRVTQLENQLADSIRQHNQEAGDLQNTMVRLHSQLEQGETERQTLEYQLTLAQKDGRQNIDNLEEREKEWESLKNSLQDRISKLTHQCQEWRSTLDTVQQARAKERTEQQHLLTIKENELLQQTTLFRKLELEHQQLKTKYSSTVDSLTKLQSKCDHIENELSLKSEAVLTLNHQLDNASDLEGNLKRHLQAATDRNKSYEDHLESMKSDLYSAQHSAKTHLHHVKELETLLGNERESHEQVARALEETKAVVASLQSSLEREERRLSLANEQLQNKENECLSLKQQTREKQSIISDLSHQLQLHIGNLEALKEELSVTKQRQVLIEESYSGALKEVDSLITVFKTRCSKQTDVKETTPTNDPSHLPEKVRQALLDFQSQLSELMAHIGHLTSDLKSERQRVQQMTDECATYRDIVSARTSAMADAEMRLSVDSKEISRLNSELTRSQTTTLSLQAQLDDLTHREKQIMSDHRATINELSTLKKTFTNEFDTHCRYLHTLLACLSSSKSKHGSSSETSSSLELLQWNTGHTASHSVQWENLASTVNTSVMALSEALKRTKREAKLLKSTNSSLVATLESADALYKESTGKMTSSIEEQERQWTQRTNELKNQYDSKLLESEEKCVEFERQVIELKREEENTHAEKNHCETLLSQAEERIKEQNQSIKIKTQNLSLVNQQIEECRNREKNDSHKTQQLEEQLSQMQEVHRGYKNDRACLLACTCLLAGSLFPALQRVQELTVQRSALQNQVATCERLHSQVCDLVKSIQTDIGEPQNQSSLENSQCSLIACSTFASHPLLRFRKVTIAVIAANRLRKLTKTSRSLFNLDLVTPSQQRHLSVHIGYRPLKTSKQNLVTTGAHPQQRFLTTDIASWLRSEKVLNDIRESFSDLQSTLDSCTSHQSKQSSQRPSSRLRTSSKRKFDDHGSRVIINPTRECFTHLLEKMSSRFEQADLSSHTHKIASLTNGSLCSRLRRGLEKALQRLPSKHGYIGSTELGESLHTQLASLVGRLHEVEMERHSLLLQLDQSKTEQERLSSACQDALDMESQVEKLQRDLAGMVSHERYMSVCSDLEETLKREQDLKVCLSQHGEAVRQLQTRLHQEGQNIETKTAAISVAEKEMNELRVNLQHKEQQLRETNKQLEHCNKERVHQAKQLGELQSSLTTCRRQISIAHAAVAAESDMTVRGSLRTETEREHSP